MTARHLVPSRHFKLALALLFATSTLHAAEAERRVERTVTAHAGMKVELRNLAGNVTVARASGNEIRILGTIHAEGSSPAEAERVANLLELRVDESGGRWLVKAVYPLAESRHYHYPRRDDADSLPWILDWLNVGESNFKYDEQRVSVSGNRRSGALTLYADFRLEIPDGVDTTVMNGIGAIASSSVSGDQWLDISSGQVVVRDSRGRLGIDTGSGDVTVARHQGDIDVDTGSGDVELDSVLAGLVSVDTGSGDVRMNGLSGSLQIDTGSGDIVGTNITIGTRLLADTGSGDVRLSGDFSATQRIVVDTGSGDVTFEATPASAAPDVRMSIDTGSGEIACDLPASRITRSGSNALRVEIGRASGTATISTGSGDVILRGRG